MFERLSLIAFILLFIWISFFSSLVGKNPQFLFLFFLIAILILTCIKGKKYKLIFNKAEIPFFLFFATMAMGIVNVKDPAVAYWHFWFSIFPVPFIYFFAKVAFDNKYSILIVRSACIMASLVFIFGIIEFITKQNFIYSGYVYNFCYQAFKGRRMMSTHIHPTPLGTYFVAILPLSIALSLKEKKASLKFMFSICGIFNFIGIILTFSRGVLLGAFVSIFVMAIFLTKQKKRFLFLVSILLIIIIGFCSFIVHWRYADFYRYSLQGLSSKWSYLSKICRFIAVGKILREHPFFGLGLGHFRVMFDRYLPQLANVCGYDTKVADCMYITLLAETGLIGFAVFILFICSLFKQIKMRLKSLSGNENRLLLICFLSGLIGIMCSFLTYDGLYWRTPSYLFWSYAGILSSLSRRSENE